MTLPRTRRALIVGPLFAVLLAGLLFGVGRASDFLQIVDTYWRVHDEVLLPAEEGRRYIDLYWTYGGELVDLIQHNQAAFDMGRDIIEAFEPPLRALVDGRGQEVGITNDMVIQVEAYLDLLMKIGSPDLQAAIREERARTPLRDLVGMTFEEARLKLLGPPQLEFPSPTSTSLP